MKYSTILVAGALLAGCSQQARDPRGVDRDEVLLHVTATGRSESRPDEARFTVGVSSIAASGPEASRANAAKMNAVVARLRALGVAEGDIQTSQLTVARQDWGANRGKFEATNSVSVRLRDTAKAGEAVAAATAAGANVMSGPDFRVADPEAASRKAYADAYRAARARADAYAEAAGMTVARILTISDAGGGGGIPVPPPVVMAEQSNARTVAPPVMPGTDAATVAVSVSFALGRK